MMSTRTYTLSLLIVIILVAVFGLYIPFVGMMGHDMGCPLSFGGATLCPAPLAHLSYWQTAFAATLVELLILCALAVASFALFDFSQQKDTERKRYHLHIYIPLRPTLFQELFAQGILNRRAP